MYTRSRGWLKVLLAGGCLLQLSACVGDPNYFLASTAVTWITSKTVQFLVNAMFL
jgi:hypothetical protein